MTTSKKAIETIKLMGNQIIEIRQVINRQNEAIQTLKSELLKTRGMQQEGSGNIKMLQIDQKDLAEQIRKIRSVLDVMQNSLGEDVYMEIEEEVPVLDDIYPANPLDRIDELLMIDEDHIEKRYYPNYEDSKVVANNKKATTTKTTRKKPAKTAAKTTSKAKQTKAASKKEEFGFDRIPKLLNL